MASLGQLFVELGVFGDVEDLKKAEKRIEDFIKTNDKAKKSQDDFSKNIKKGIKALRGTVLAITGAVYALNRLTNSLMQSNNAMLDLTRQSDISLNTFQKWDGVGKMFGINNAAQQLENLNERLFELRLTGEGARGFQLAGIMPTNAEDVMEQLRNRIRGLDNTSASYILKQMGLDPKMITLLRLSREEYSALASEISKYQLTEEQRESLMKMNVQLQLANQKMQYFKDSILVAIMPKIVRFTKFIASAAEGLGRCVKWLIKADTPLAKLTRGTLALLSAILLVKGALMAITAHPIIAALTGIIGAIMLIADDVNHYFNGGGSVIGVIMKAMHDFEKTGIFSDNIPVWIQMLATAAHELYEVYTKYIGNKKLKEDSIDKTRQVISNNENLSRQDAQNLIKGMSAPTSLPEIITDKFISGLVKNLSPINWLRGANNKNNISNNNSRTTITQTNYIETETPVDDIYNQLLFTNAAYGR